MSEIKPETKAEITVIPYKVEHFFAIQKYSHYASMLHTLYGFTSAMDLAKIYTKGPAYTMCIDGEIALIAGIIRMWEGVGEAWVIATPLARKHPVSLHKLTLRYMDSIIRDTKLIRVQSIVEVGFEAGHRWIKRLGFKEEGLMRKYFGNRDFIRYSKVQDSKVQEEGE